MNDLSNGKLVSETGARLKVYGPKDIDSIAHRAGHSESDARVIRAITAVLPFRVTSYVLEQLVDWINPADCPILRMVVPHPNMFAPEEMAPVLAALDGDGDLATVVRAIRMRLNPHPAGQLEHNVPTFRGQSLRGIQHKYDQTILVFPRQGQTCHSYCTYCFRWAQFTRELDMRMALKDDGLLTEYLLAHPEVTDVLITGGDPLIMRSELLGRYVDQLLEPRLESVQNIRIGSKALAFWPYRFVTDDDADELLRLFEKVVRAGKHLALMAHFSHPRELETTIVAEAIRRIRSTGAHIYTQAPLVRHVNDDAATWATMWRLQTRFGMTPYYMFVERDTGPHDYFAVPLVRAWEIFRSAYQDVSGLSRTVRGPVMSTTPGKVCVDGVADVLGERVLGFHFVQARDQKLVGTPMFARYDADATWFTQLRPAFGASSFPFSTE